MKEVIYNINDHTTYREGIIYNALNQKRIKFTGRSGGNFAVSQEDSSKVDQISKDVQIPISYVGTFDKTDSDYSSIAILGIVAISLLAIFSKKKKRKK